MQLTPCQHKLHPYRKGFFFQCYHPSSFLKGPKQLLLSHLPQTSIQWSYQCQELFLLFTLEPLSWHSSYPIEPCAFMLLQSNSMLSPFNESPWRLQVVSSFQLLWSFLGAFCWAASCGQKWFPESRRRSQLISPVGFSWSSRKGYRFQLRTVLLACEIDTPCGLSLTAWHPNRNWDQ